MSIFPTITHLLKREHEYRPIEGEVLLMGRQTVENSSLTDVELFASICPARVQALDASPYEGAEIVHDLCTKLPAKLHGCADFIFNGSCLDNIYDPAHALRSMSAMLRPGGRILLFEHGTAIQGALVTFSPEWFFDFFAVNNYVDCQIKLGVFKRMVDPWLLVDWHPFEGGMPVSATPGTRLGDFVSIVLAEKGADTTDDVAPIQAQYRKLHGHQDNEYLLAYNRYLQSSRRHA